MLCGERRKGDSAPFLGSLGGTFVLLLPESFRRPFCPCSLSFSPICRPVTARVQNTVPTIFPPPPQRCRLVALSASLANAKDAAAWCAATPHATFNFPPAVRPVPLQAEVRGIDIANYESRMQVSCLLEFYHIYTEMDVPSYFKVGGGGFVVLCRNRIRMLGWMCRQIRRRIWLPYC